MLAGCWFTERRDDRDPNDSYEPDRDQLEAIAAQAAKLKELLTSMSNVSAESLWHPFHQISLLVLRMPPSGFVTNFGLTVFQRAHANGSFSIEHLRPHQIEEAVRVLHLLAAQAATSLPKQKGGQRQFRPRQDWVNSARYFWRSHSKYAFDTRSAAVDFCHLAFRQLDKNVKEQEIRSAIRSANALYKELEKRRSQPAQESR